MIRVLLIHTFGLKECYFSQAITDKIASFCTEPIKSTKVESTTHLFSKIKCLFKTTDTEAIERILKELESKNSFILHYEIINYTHYIKSSQLSHTKYILTLMAASDITQNLKTISKQIKKFNIIIDRITPNSIINQNSRDHTVKSVLKIELIGTQVKISNLRKQLNRWAYEQKTDFILTNQTYGNTNKNLICFDMDSTLIKTEVIDELAKHANVEDQVKTITEKAMQGEIDFNTSFSKRVQLLKGINETVMQDIAQNLPLTEGFESLFALLSRYNYKTAIISGGFHYFAHHLQNKFGIDYIFTNNLEIADGKLTGNYIEPIINGEVKSRLVYELAEQENIKQIDTIAIGDGANDIPMLKNAGVGIAFHAKPIVKREVEHSINFMGLDSLIYILNLTDNEFI